MKDYLRSSVDLIKQAAWSFPTFVERATAAGRQATDPFDAAALSDAEMDALLDHAFERYFATSGLFGTPERCRQMVDRLTAIGVDEIACLIDFGVPTEQVLESLPHLKQLMDAPSDKRPMDRSLRRRGHRDPSRHASAVHALDGVDAGRRCGRTLGAGGSGCNHGRRRSASRHARQGASLAGAGKVLNVYGPTETTVWSSLCDVEEVGDFVPLGSRSPTRRCTFSTRRAANVRR